MSVFEKLARGEWDKSLYCTRGKEGETFGHNPDYLLDKHNLTKSDLIRLERKGLAIKALYEVRHPKADLWDALDKKLAEQHALNKTAMPGPIPTVPRKNGNYRVRWILFAGAGIKRGPYTNPRAAT